ncbi:hypothetical protein BABA_24100 [Neobacillus bataviensis LMG 21833]|uniref:Uncharacterized protein n=1 Tax=Neobacillus bataviensis LMG 21833 TaxID=1117379 RepID=K6DSU2_9BACI|nr:hypothetical protein BABA_24100 [Neobacillus bataviensis LMG 21833]
MNLNVRFLTTIVTALLFTVLVFMNFLGYWKANSTIQILFFFIMIGSVLNAGTEIGKNLKKRS